MAIIRSYHCANMPFLSNEMAGKYQVEINDKKGLKVHVIIKAQDGHTIFEFINGRTCTRIFNMGVLNGRYENLQRCRSQK